MRFLFSLPLPLLLILLSFPSFDTQAAPLGSYKSEEPWSTTIRPLRRLQNDTRSATSPYKGRNSRLAEPYLAKPNYDDVKPLASIAEGAPPDSSYYDNLSTEEVNKQLDEARSELGNEKDALNEAEQLLNTTIEQAKTANEDYEAKKEEYERLNRIAESAEELVRNVNDRTADVSRLQGSVKKLEGLLKPDQENVEKWEKELEDLNDIDNLVTNAGNEVNRLDGEITKQVANVTALEGLENANETLAAPLQAHFNIYDQLFTSQNCIDTAKSIILPCSDTITKRDNSLSKLTPAKALLASATATHADAVATVAQLRLDKTAADGILSGLETKQVAKDILLNNAETQLEKAYARRNITEPPVVREKEHLRQAGEGLRLAKEAKEKADSDGTSVDAGAARIAANTVFSALETAKQEKTTRDDAVTAQREVNDGKKKLWDTTNARIEALQKQVEKRTAKGGMNPAHIGAIVGCLIGCVVIVGIVAGVFVYRKKGLRKRREKKGGKPSGDSVPCTAEAYLRVKGSKSNSVAITESARELKQSVSKAEQPVDKLVAFHELSAERQAGIGKYYHQYAKEGALISVDKDELFFRFATKFGGYEVSFDGEVYAGYYDYDCFKHVGYANEGDSRPPPSSEKFSGPVCHRANPNLFVNYAIKNECPDILKAEPEDRLVAGSDCEESDADEEFVMQDCYDLQDGEWTDEPPYPNLEYYAEEAERRRRVAAEEKEKARWSRRLVYMLCIPVVILRRLTNRQQAAPERTASGQDVPTDQEDEPTQRTTTMVTGQEDTSAKKVDKKEEEPVAKIPDAVPPQETKKDTSQKEKKIVEDKKSEKDKRVEETQDGRDEPKSRKDPRGRKNSKGSRSKASNGPKVSKKHKKRSKQPKWAKQARQKGHKLLKKYERSESDSDRGSDRSSSRSRTTTITTTVTKKFKQLFKSEKLSAERMDEMINILSYGTLCGVKLTMHFEDMCIILDMIAILFEEGKTMLEVELPAAVVGDIHGRITVLLQIFASYSKPGQPAWKFRKTLFLGDYVDRGATSCQTMILLFVLKLRHPNMVFLLRGNHEDAQVNGRYGFRAELIGDWGEERGLTLWDKFNDAFARMPLCALLDGRIICMHGGIPKNLTSLAQINDEKLIPRVLYNLQHNEFAAELSWDDPARGQDGYAPNGARGDGRYPQMFGENAAEAKCKLFKIDMIVRGHQPQMTGFRCFAGYRVITVFSAPAYEALGNMGAALDFEKDGSWGPRTFTECTFLRGAEDTPAARRKAFEDVYRCYCNKCSYHTVAKYRPKEAALPGFSVGALPRKSDNPAADDELTTVGPPVASC